MSGKTVIRHQFIDRLLHWLFAGSILVLLFTGLLPKLGIDFAWLELHWISGLMLNLFTIFHLARVLLLTPLLTMWLGVRDFKAGRAGKFSLAQKLMDNGVALITLVAIATGLLMMVRIDTPLWERDPYWLTADAWGLIYVLHGLMALLFVSVIMLHGYF